MTRLLALACLLAAAPLGLAQETSPLVFTPPEAYPVDRYEAAWSKNPFTLKTAPAVVESVSFAKDLAIVSHYGDKENPTIVIVNTKTHDRIRLKKGETASNGVRLTEIKLGETRRDTVVEVVLGSETTELKYNPEYMSQMAASGGGVPKPAAGMPGNPAQRPAGVPGINPGMQQRPMPGVNGVQPRIQLPSNAAPGAQPAGVSQRGGMGAPVGGNNINLSPNPAQAPGPLVSDANGNAPPVPVRRRLIAPPSNQVQ